MNNPETTPAETKNHKPVPGCDMKVGEYFVIIDRRYADNATGNPSQKGKIVAITNDTGEKMVEVMCDDGNERQWYAKYIVGRKENHSPDENSNVFQ